MKIINKKEIKEIIFQCIDDINSTRINKKKIDKKLDSNLSSVDSLGLVMLVLNIEEKIFDNYQKKINLNKKISQKKMNLKSLIEYIYEEI
jgi:acyl carrier protein